MGQRLVVTRRPQSTIFRTASDEKENVGEKECRLRTVNAPPPMCVYPPTPEPAEGIPGASGASGEDPGASGGEKEKADTVDDCAVPPEDDCAVPPETHAAVN